MHPLRLLGKFLQRPGKPGKPLNTLCDSGPVVFFTPGAFFMAGAITGLYLVFYLTDPSTPPLQVQHGVGWKGWFDQGEYYKTAESLALLKLTPSFYWYGYPALGALFYRWLPLHPFLLPNLFFVVGMVLCFYAACRRLLTAAESWFIAIISFVCDRNLWVVSLVYPWNSIPTFFAVFAIAWLTIFGPATRCNFVLAALTIGLATFCRPPDCPALLCLYYGSLVFNAGNRRNLWLIAAPLLAIGGAVSLQLGAHLILYKSALSPYLAAVEGVGFSFRNPIIKLYQWFVDPTLLNGDTMLPPGTPARGTLSRLPLLLFLAPGCLLIFKTVGPKVFGLVGACGVTGLIYLSFNPTSYPSHYWSYYGFHHVWWFAPWAALCAWLSLTRAWRRLNPLIFAATLLLPICVVSIVSFQSRLIQRYPLEMARAKESSEATGFQGGTHALVELRGDTLKLTIPLRSHSEIFAVRVLGKPAVPFHASASVAKNNFKVTYNNQLLRPFIDYFALGYPEELYLSFINAPLTSGVLTVKACPALDARPSHVDLLGVEFKPGAAFARWGNTRNMPAPSGADSLRTAKLRSGWSPGGVDYVWTIGPRAVLELPRPTPGKPLNGLVIEAAAFVPQNVTVLLDGKEVGRIGVHDRATHKINLSAVPDLPEHKIIVLISNPTKPVDIGMNSDNRPLGIAVWRVDYSQ